MTPDQIAKARERSDVYAAAVALKRSGAWETGLCPMHPDKSPSFAVRNGKWVCFSGCGGGDTISFVQRTKGFGFADAVRWLLDMPEVAPRGPKTERTAKSNRRNEFDDNARVQAILRECGPVTDQTAAWLYLFSRGISTKQPGLLSHPSLYCHEVGKPLPALVAPITDSRGSVTALQRIWCVGSIDSGTQDGRAPLQTRKKSLGSLSDGAVRLAPPGAIMGLAEGVESAAAAAQLFRVGAWSVCGLSRLGYPAHWSTPKDGAEPRWIEERAPSVWIPKTVRQLMIFGDRGAIGETVAKFAAAWWTRQGLRAMAVFPDAGFGDFNDMLIGKKGEAA